MNIKRIISLILVLVTLIGMLPQAYAEETDLTSTTDPPVSTEKLAEPMQRKQLYDAQQKYDEGLDFYVSYYPGQTQYIRRLMPNVKFF